LTGGQELWHLPEPDERTSLDIQERLPVTTLMETSHAGIPTAIGDSANVGPQGH
jgi:hypothetical protein